MPDPVLTLRQTFASLREIFRISVAVLPRWVSVVNISSQEAQKNLKKSAVGFHVNAKHGRGARVTTTLAWKRIEAMDRLGHIERG